MFQQREHEMGDLLPRDARKSFMYKHLRHYMLQEQMSYETRRAMWAEAKIHRKRIEFGL